MHAQVQTTRRDQNTPSEGYGQAKVHWVFITIGCEKDDREGHSD